MRLEAEGLVDLEQNKGFRVAEVSRESLFDLMQSRIEIETIALRLVAGKRRRRMGGRSACALSTGCRGRASSTRMQPDAIKFGMVAASIADIPCGAGRRLRLADLDGDPREACSKKRSVMSPSRSCRMRHCAMTSPSTSNSCAQRSETSAAPSSSIASTSSGRWNKVAESLENHPEFSRSVGPNPRAREALVSLAG